MVDRRNPSDATYFTQENENAIASKPGDPPAPQRQLEYDHGLEYNHGLESLSDEAWEACAAILQKAET